MLFRFWVFPDCTFLDISIADATNYAKSNIGKSKSQETSFEWWARGSILTSETVLPSGKISVRIDAKYNATAFGVRPVICIAQN